MKSKRFRLLGVSLIAITVVFIVFFQGMIRSQLTKMHIEEQLKETLYLEAFQLEATYNNIHSVTDQIVMNQHAEMDARNEAYVKSVVGMLEGHRRADQASGDVKKQVIEVVTKLNAGSEQRIWIINSQGQVLCSPVQRADGTMWKEYPRLHETVREFEREPGFFRGEYAYLTEKSGDVRGFVYYDQQWDWSVVCMASIDPILELENRLHEQSVKRMEDEIALMSIHGTAAVLTEDLVVKYYSVSSMQGEPLIMNDVRTQESIADILAGNKNAMVEFAVLDAKSLKDRTQLAYVNYDADRKLYFVITRNREDLFENINLHSLQTARVLGIAALLLLLVNGYLILRELRLERMTMMDEKINL